MKKELHFYQIKSFIEEVKIELGYTPAQYVEAWEGIRKIVGITHISAKIAVIDNGSMKKIMYRDTTSSYVINMLETKDGWYFCATRHGKRGCVEMHKSTKKLWEVVNKVLGY